MRAVVFAFIYGILLGVVHDVLDLSDEPAQLASIAFIAVLVGWFAGREQDHG